jgi:5-methylcytosine-specific restriction endonuclease McrA
MKFPLLDLDETALRAQSEHPHDCKHADKRLRRRDDKNGIPWLFYQCQDCGQKIGNRVSSKSLSPSELASLLAFDEEFERHTWVEYNKRYTAAREAEREKLRENWNQSYNEYLRSPEWAARRELVLKRENHLCEGCRTARATQAHHTTYQNIGDEFLFELVALCRPCHERYHQKVMPRVLEDLFLRGFSGPPIDVEYPNI